MKNEKDHLFFVFHFFPVTRFSGEGKISILFLIISLLSSSILIAQNPDTQDLPTQSIDTTGLNSLLNVNNTYFPMQAAFGVEIGRVFNLAGQDRTEFGINVLATSWHHLEKKYQEGKQDTDKAGMFQIGTFLTANRMGFGQTNDLWQLNLGVLYNRILVDARSIGLSARLKGSTFLGPDTGEFLSNLYLKPEIGFTFAGILNLYYGRNYALQGNVTLPTQSITLHMNINVSYFKFGLQGI